jgi:16S rRNA (guanine1207-N2)-methyltransferase
MHAFPVPSDHYFSNAPSVASNPKTVQMLVAGSEVTLETDAGIFSHDRIDPGTQVLLRTVPVPPPSGNLLDLGCGYGPIAIYIALQAPGALVYAVDINERALEVARRNAESNGATNVRTHLPEEIDPDLRLDAIYCNPPIRVGKAALHEMLELWLNRLSPAGTAYLVVQKHLGSDSLAEWLRESGYEVERLASKRAYRVFAVRKP